MMCDKRALARQKAKVWKTVVRAVMLFSSETVKLRIGLQAELEVARIKMLSFSLVETRVDRIRNKSINGTVCVR